MILLEYNISQMPFWYLKIRFYSVKILKETFSDDLLSQKNLRPDTKIKLFELGTKYPFKTLVKSMK